MLTTFDRNEAKKIKKILQKKNQNSRPKKSSFPAPPILNIFSRKFNGLVLRLVGLIDAKGIDFAQAVWL